MSKDTSSEIKIPKVCVLKFQAIWCGPCKALTPFVESMEKNYPKLPVIVVDADENQDLCQKYNVKRLPTLVFINGDHIKYVVGTDQSRILIEFESLNKLNADQTTVALPEGARIDVKS